MNDITPRGTADINEDASSHNSDTFRPIDGPKTPVDTIDVPSTPNKPHKKGRWHWLRFKRVHLSKKQWALVIVAAVILLCAGVIGAIYLYKHFTKLPAQSAVVKNAKPKTEPSRLTGLQVSPELNKRPITGVMIENSPDARPQSGLLDAGVVYEAIAEGGITRFLALYEEAQPKYIGPVRSVRPYYLDFLLPFQASIAHVGGSPLGLSEVRALHIRDLDQFANASAYQRVSQRYAPHNVYTSSSKLDALEKAKGFTKSDFTSFPRKKDQPAKTPNASSIDFDISSFYYNVHYGYDAKTNSYKRSEGGAAHKDERSHKTLNPKVVIALVMSYSLARDGKHSQYDTTGSGAVLVFQDGKVTKGTWRKLSRSSQISFKDASGKDIRLNAGQTWISLVGLRSDVRYKP